MKKISKKMALGISYVIIGMTAPWISSPFTNSYIDNLIEKYENGAALGVEIEFSESVPVAEIIINEKSANGEIVVKKGTIFIKHSETYTPDNLPAGIDFHLATTELYHENVEFRKSADFWLGPFGHPPDILDEFKEIPQIVGNIISGLQGIMIVLRRNNQDEKGFLFYECKHLIVIYIKKIEINLKN